MGTLLVKTLDQVRPGTRLARTVWGSDGRLLLERNTVLRAAHIRRLRAAGVAWLYVFEPGWEETPPPEVVPDRVRDRVAKVAWDAFARLVDGRSLPLGRVVEAVRLLVDEVLAQPFAIAVLAEMRAASDVLFGHSVHVALLALLAGRRLGLERADLVELGTGALMHDVGKAYVPAEVLRKPGTLTADEWQLVRAHPQRGYEALRGAGADLLVAHVALQHHERWDGSGYPRGLKGDQIHLYGQICAVCDVLDAATSPRPYRDGAMSLPEALRHLQEGAGLLYGKSAVRALVQSLAPYPVATLVRLDDGTVGVVKEVAPDAPERPKVRVFRSANGDRLRQYVDVDLLADPARRIAGPILPGFPEHGRDASSPAATWEMDTSPPSGGRR